MTTGEQFVRDEIGLAAIPPMETPDGSTLPDGTPAGVLAHVFACGSCDDAEGRFVAFVERYPAEQKAALANQAPSARTMKPQFTQVAAVPQGARPADLVWQPLTSEAGERVLKIASERCEGGIDAIECYPD